MKADTLRFIRAVRNNGGLLHFTGRAYVGTKRPGEVCNAECLACLGAKIERSLTRKKKS